MKMTDGLFHKVFDEIAPEYPDIQTDHMIIDIGAARLATRPDQFDVIVTPNLYGDIISDIAAELTGSVGLAPSANIGEHVAMFEAIHGSAPDIAGKGIANPSGLLLAAVMMLVHIGQADAAERIHNAWLSAIEDGVHTAELHSHLSIGRPFGSMDFADAVIDRLGNVPQKMTPVSYAHATEVKVPVAAPAQAVSATPAATKALVGIDVFVHAAHTLPDALAAQLQACTPAGLELQVITNRGVKVWPGGFPETFCTDHWRCRYVATNGEPLDHRALVTLMASLADHGIDFIKTENLCTFDGARGFALAQGQ
jgi:isocitrate dehydrogenase